jgi:hypothetical protein
VYYEKDFPEGANMKPPRVLFDYLGRLIFYSSKNGLFVEGKVIFG